MFSSIYKGRKVLVTGHTGFKGSWLAEWLLKLGAEVIGYSKDIPSQPSHFEVLGLKERLHHIVGDVRDIASLRRTLDTEQPEIVFHLAAQPIVSLSIDDPIETFETNVMGTVHVLHCLKSSPSVKAAVIITSDKCYENVEWEYGYRESDRIGGKDPYSASKGCAEIAFHSYFRTYLSDMSSLKLATARAGNVIGGGDWARDRIIPDCARAWGQNLQPTIRSPHATRPWQHVLEPLSGYLCLAAELFQNRSHINGESFNFGPPAETNHSVELLLQELVKQWKGQSWKNQESTLSKKEAGLLKLNCDKALHRLNWLPTLNFSETAAMTAAWYEAYYRESDMASMTRQQISQYELLAQERRRNWC